MQWYDEWAQKRSDNYNKNHYAFYAEPSIEYIAPFKIADDLYYDCNINEYTRPTDPRDLAWERKYVYINYPEKTND